MINDERCPIVVPLIVEDQERSYQLTVSQSEYDYDLTVTSTLNEIALDMGMSINVDIIEGEYYEGETVVTPKANAETILDTSHKVMAKDVRVKELPIMK